MTNTDDFGAWIQAQLDERGWNQTDLAREAGISRQSINYYLSERSKYPSLDGVVAICKALNVPISDALVTLGLVARHVNDAKIDQAVALLEQLEPADQEEAIRFLRFRLNAARGKKRKKLR